jgi:hypothetical protein
MGTTKLFVKSCANNGTITDNQTADHWIGFDIPAAFLGQINGMLHPDSDL